ncbi:hypothetical protein MTO96_039398, partial [Rhipicephalus appendiculatus]
MPLINWNDATVEDLHGFTTDFIRHELSRRNLETTGSKDEMIERLLHDIAQNRQPSVVSDVPRLITETVKAQGQALSARLDDLEDKSRRENLLFFGISDSPNETWAQSEGHVRDLLSRHLDMHISDSEASRAH